MKIKYLLGITILSILLVSNVPISHGLDSIIDVNELSIRGNISDNYVSLTYEMVFDNSGGFSDDEVNREFTVPSGLFLSNVSGTIGDETFYGVVKEINQAQQEYTDAVGANKTAILVESAGTSSYRLKVNVKAGIKLVIAAELEGFLNRQLGSYYLELYPFPDAPLVDFSLDLELVSTLSPLTKAKLTGLGAVTTSSITNGYRITYSENGFVQSQSINLEYRLDEIAPGGRVLTYTNGTDNFFLYLLAPEIHEATEQTAKEYVFVIDVSGSMGANSRIQKAKNAFTEIIKNLNGIDRFNVISFSTTASSLWAESKLASISNIEAAVDWVNGLSASGSTNIDAALSAGLSSFNSDFVSAKALTILSDGDPTAGELDPTEIRNNAQGNNVAEALIFSIAFGADISIELMSGLAYDNGGKFVQILDGSSATEELLNFYSEFSTPVASDFNIDYTEVNSVFPVLSEVAQPIFNGSEIIQTGIFKGVLEVTTNIQFNSYNETYTNQVFEPGTVDTHVERIWALNAIESLVASYKNSPSVEISDQIINLAVEYGIVVNSFTAMIIVIDIIVTDDISTQTYVDFTNAPSQGDTIIYSGAEDVGGLAAFDGFTGIMGIIAVAIFRISKKRKINK